MNELNMTVYLVAHIRIHDRTRYAQYEAGFGEVFAQFRGTILGVDDDTNHLEGENPTDRSVIISFPSEEDALAWYNSDAYQTIAVHRFESSDAELTLVRSGMNTRPAST